MDLIRDRLSATVQACGVVLCFLSHIHNLTWRRRHAAHRECQLSSTCDGPSPGTSRAACWSISELAGIAMGSLFGMVRVTSCGKHCGVNQGMRPQNTAPYNAAPHISLCMVPKCVPPSSRYSWNLVAYSTPPPPSCDILRSHVVRRPNSVRHRVSLSGIGETLVASA